MATRRRPVGAIPLLCAVLVPLSGAFTLAGCGQTGALYFDEAPPADQLPPSRRAAPVSLVPMPLPANDAAATPAPAGAAAPDDEAVPAATKP